MRDMRYCGEANSHLVELLPSHNRAPQSSRTYFVITFFYHFPPYGIITELPKMRFRTYPEDL